MKIFPFYQSGASALFSGLDILRTSAASTLSYSCVFYSVCSGPWWQKCKTQFGLLK